MQLFAEIDNPLPPHAERVRIRRDAGLSQRALSIALGVAERNVCNWEKPDAPEPTPTHKALYRLALEELDRRTKALQAKKGSDVRQDSGLALVQK
jgi:transcriptional regulator with XRE-family HTH domain